ncbi:helix-turn-helix transcriptional regulator [Streptomyces sp. NPDC057939]|uniref:helix-turn-helix transcriptional regulator n=1 Tax=Streptomyces sp. NPDC057939 TaxID=3346284 RepID=UPI0036EB3F53
MTEMTGSGGGPDAHRPLGVPSRRRLLSLLRAANHPMGAAELATAAELSAATVRHHLRALTAAGLVRSLTLAGSGSGRPRLCYAPAGYAGADPAHRALADALTGDLAREPALARQAGRAWGRRLTAANGPVPPVAHVLAQATRMGFVPEAVTTPDGTTRLLLHDCPYRHIARAHPRAVCALHQGVLDGLLEEHPVRARLRPFLTPGVCGADVGPALP